MTDIHQPVLLQQFLEYYSDLVIETFIDGTLGCGGHASALLQEHDEIKNFIGVDQDQHARKIAQQELAPFKDKVTIVASNFADIDKLNINNVDGILLDIGVSSLQLDDHTRGFSFMKDGPLDMRMNPQGKISARDIVNNATEEELGKIFRNYGEEPKWRRAAHAIVHHRKKQSIETTHDLVKALAPVLPRKRNINPVTLIFQGLRIAVNDELRVLERVLPVAIKMLRSGGIFAVITFHSLEDRIVKTIFREQAANSIPAPNKPEGYIPKEPTVRILTKRPVVASDEEKRFNPRSRSAKMRVIEKL